MEEEIPSLLGFDLLQLGFHPGVIRLRDERAEVVRHLEELLGQRPELGVQLLALGELVVLVVLAVVVGVRLVDHRNNLVGCRLELLRGVLVFRLRARELQPLFTRAHVAIGDLVEPPNTGLLARGPGLRSPFLRIRQPARVSLEAVGDVVVEAVHAVDETVERLVVVDGLRLRLRRRGSAGVEESCSGLSELLTTNLRREKDDGDGHRVRRVSHWRSNLNP